MGFSKALDFSQPASAPLRSGRIGTVRMMAKNIGFTLLEIVVAVAIFAVISAIVFPALMQFLEMRERVEEKHQHVVGLQKTFQFMANDLRFAVNRLAKDEYGEPIKTTMTINDEVLLGLTARYPDLNLDGLNVPRRVSWQLQDGMVQRIQSPVMDPESGTRTIVQDLLEEVQSVEIQVSEVVDGRDVTDDKWEQQSRLPSLIDVTIKMSNGLEYRRLFAMPGSDTKAAVNAVVVAQGSGVPVNTNNLDSSR